MYASARSQHTHTCSWHAHACPWHTHARSWHAHPHALSLTGYSKKYHKCCYCLLNTQSFLLLFVHPKFNTIHSSNHKYVKFHSMHHVVVVNYGVYFCEGKNNVNNSYQRISTRKNCSSITIVLLKQFTHSDGDNFKHWAVNVSNYRKASQVSWLIHPSAYNKLGCGRIPSLGFVNSDTRFCAHHERQMGQAWVWFHTMSTAHPAHRLPCHRHPSIAMSPPHQCLGWQQPNNNHDHHRWKVMSAHHQHVPTSTSTPFIHEHPCNDRHPQPAPPTDDKCPTPFTNADRLHC